jgi:hypothetical protein
VRPTDPVNWNSIANLQPLNESLNRSKQDQSLVDWVAERKILCRSAYTKVKSWVPNVQSVAFGDVIHFYFIGPLGSSFSMKLASTTS